MCSIFVHIANNWKLTTLRPVKFSVLILCRLDAIFVRQTSVTFGILPIFKFSRWEHSVVIEIKLLAVRAWQPNTSTLTRLKKTFISIKYILKNPEKLKHSFFLLVNILNFEMYISYTPYFISPYLWIKCQHVKYENIWVIIVLQFKCT